MLTPLVNLATSLLTAAQPLILPVVAIAISFAGLKMMFGNSEHGKIGVAMALVGGVIMLGAQTMAAGLHA